MEGMKQFFLNLGAYAGPIIILLAEILIAGILLGCFALLSRKRKEKRREWEGEHLYYTAIPRAAGGACPNQAGRFLPDIHYR